jgi:hypothetical protein
MARGSLSRAAIMLFVCLTGLLLVGCNALGSYPDPNGPRDGDGLLVDPQTGISLPGQFDGGV